MSNKELKIDTFTLPEARVIHHSLFVKDAFNDKSVPSYKIEVAIEADSDEHISLEEKLMDYADMRWGSGAGDEEDLILPLLDGNKLAKKRERKEKDGSAYKGMIVMRSNTIYNLEGIDGPGGVQVFNPEAEAIAPAQQGEVYPGCYGIVAVNVGFYESEDNEGDMHHAIKFYLAAFQKTRDGERLATGGDRSSLFKPVGRPEGEGNARRSRRARRES